MSFIPVSLLPIVAVVLVVILIASLRYRAKVIEDKKWLDRAWPVNIDEIINIVGRHEFDLRRFSYTWNFVRVKIAERDLRQFLVVAAMFKFWSPTRPLVPHSVDASILYQCFWGEDSDEMTKLLWRLGKTKTQPLDGSKLDDPKLRRQTQELVDLIFWNRPDKWPNATGQPPDVLLLGDLWPFLRAPGNTDKAISWSSITTRQLLRFVRSQTPNSSIS